MYIIGELQILDILLVAPVLEVAVIFYRILIITIRKLTQIEVELIHLLKLDRSFHPLQAITT